MDYSLFFLKPEAFQKREIIRQIFDYIQRQGLSVVYYKEISMQPKLVKILHSKHLGSPTFTQVIEQLTSMPLPLFVVRGTQASIKLYALKKQVRAEFNAKGDYNFLHVPDPNEVGREYELLCPELALLKLPKAL